MSARYCATCCATVRCHPADMTDDQGHTYPMNVIEVVASLLEQDMLQFSYPPYADTYAAAHSLMARAWPDYI